VAIDNLTHSPGDCPPRTTFIDEKTYPINLDSDSSYPPHPLDKQVLNSRTDGDNLEIGEYGKRLFGSRSVVFDEVKKIYPFRYRWEVEKEMRLLLEGVDKPTKRRLEKRLVEFDRCGNVVSVRTCSCCGEGRDGSGSFAGTHRTCKMTVCPTCSWVRAKKVSEFYERAAEKIGYNDLDYEWQFLTLTTQYNPSNEADVTWQALRARALLVAKEASELWKRVLKVEGAAMFRSTECSFRGHVHAHLLYFGPKVDTQALTDLAQSLFGNKIGYIHSRPIEYGDQTGNQLPILLANVARYMAKGASNHGADFDEGHYGYEGDKISTMDPRLAARWELATSIRRTHLTQKYGALRGVEYQRSDYSYEPPDDSEVACKHCGVVGEWHSVIKRAEIWMQDCHGRGNAAMIGGRWIPWWKRKQNEHLLNGW